MGVSLVKQYELFFYVNCYSISDLSIIKGQSSKSEFVLNVSSGIFFSFCSFEERRTKFNNALAYLNSLA